jgi:DNA-binding NarL/FixJ family response regulator
MARTERASGSTGRPSNAVRVVVVDDHPLFRRGLADAMRDEPGITVCAEADSVGTALTSIAAHRPDVAIIDLSLGDESGLDLVTTLAKTHPDVRVLVLSGHDERVHADRALKAGALGYIMKDKAASELAAAVRRVAAGKSYVSPETADRILRTLGVPQREVPRSGLDRLSDRERRVLTMMGRGLTTREIATELDLSVKTVESHYAHMKDKLGARNSRELMRIAVAWSEDNPV